MGQPLPRDDETTGVGEPDSGSTGAYGGAVNGSPAVETTSDSSPSGGEPTQAASSDDGDRARIEATSAPAGPPGSVRPGGTGIAGFEITGELARGGMGVVYQAHDPSLDREVAVKVLAGKLLDRPHAVRRFLDEARITGQLQHPSIPPVHRVGELPDGRPFLAMKLIKGRTLEGLLVDRPDPAQDRGRFVAAFEQVCQAVGYAHSRGVIHRDLKPENVMVGAFGEVQVMDWGLAKHLGAEPEAPDPPDSSLTEIRTLRDLGGSRTEAGSLLGTPAYMPPEQAGGELDRVDCRSDVFGLGAILCVILTGKPPYAGASMDAVRLMAIRGELGEASARLDASGAEPDLVDLCKACLARRPEDRPADAGAVARAIARHRSSAEDRARRAEVERAEAEVRAAEQKKRRRVQAALGLTFASMVVLVGGFAWWVHEQRRARRLQAERSVDRAIQEAMARYGRAREAGGDPALWGEARSVALRAKQLAFAEDASLEVRNRASTLLGEIDQIGRNRRLVAELLLIHAGMGDRVTYTGNQDFEDADRRYAKAFRDYGTDLFRLTPEQGADLLGKLGRGVEVELAAALDDWTYVGAYAPRVRAGEGILGDAGRPHDRRSFFPLTRLLDPDPLRNRIRDAAMSQEAAVLVALAREIDPAAHPAQTVNLLSVYLYWNGGQGSFGDGVGLLRKAQPHHPGDFQINHNLAFFLNVSKLHADALPFSMAAIAIRPRSTSAWLDLALAQAGLTRDVEAIASFRRAVELSPNAWSFLGRVASILEKQGKSDEADAEYRKAATLASRFPARADSTFLPAWERLGLIDEVVAGARKSVDLDPTKLDPWLVLTQLLVRRHKTPELETALRGLAGSASGAPVEAVHQLAHSLDSMGLAAEAEPLFRRALESYRKSLGPEGPLTIDLTRDLGGLLDRTHRPAEAEPLLREVLGRLRNKLPAESPALAAEMAVLARNLSIQRKWSEAEPVTRESLAIREKTQPDQWTTFNSKSILGGVLLGQERYAEAEPLLIAGYEGMKKREATIPPLARERLPEALERLVRLCEATDRPDEAARWRKDLEARKAAMSR